MAEKSGDINVNISADGHFLSSAYQFVNPLPLPIQKYEFFYESN